MNIEEKMMPIDEWNKQFSCKYMQQPISFLTEENLDRLQQHCEKTIQYGNGRILEEHQVTLELIIRYRELQQELEKEKEKNKELSEHADNLLGEKEHYQDCYDEITFKINNLISQIENAIDFMKTDKSKIKVDMYQQKEEDLKLEIVHLKKLLKEE
jgi:hypothetical protein